MADSLAAKIRRTYRQAANEVREKIKQFMAEKEAKSAAMLQDVEAGKITKEDYQKWLRGQVFIGERWEEKLDDITRVYVHADDVAREIVGDSVKNEFVRFANNTAEDIERHFRGAVSFDLYDKATVTRLLKDNPKMLPEWKINEPKDYIWNEKRVQNAVTQGIIQGDSISDIATRLTTELSTSNEKKMDNFARTAVTGAQNAGRIDRMHQAQEMGIRVRKKWLSCGDNRVRDSHAELDGTVVDVDDDFVTINGNRIAFPGDPSAPPEEVYNCRCTLLYVYPEYDEAKQEDIGYQYHATRASSLIGIAEKGLRPSRGHVGEGVYFANSAKDALEWTSETSTGGRTVLRVSEAHLKKGKLEKWSASETGYGIAESVYDGTIPLEFLEIKVNDNGDENDWWSLAEYLKNYKSKYSMLNKKTQREVDRIVEEEYKKRWK